MYLLNTLSSSRWEDDSVTTEGTQYLPPIHPASEAKTQDGSEREAQHLIFLAEYAETRNVRKGVVSSDRWAGRGSETSQVVPLCL